MTEKIDGSEHICLSQNFLRRDSIVDYLQGRVHFALLDQMKLMSTSVMTRLEIKEAIISNVTEIIDNFDPQK